MLTLADAADVLRLHANSVHRAARSGRLPGRRVGKEWRFLRPVVEQAASGGRLTKPVDPVTFATPTIPEAPVELTARQAADFLRVETQTVWIEANAGRLPAWKEGGEWRTSLRALREYLIGDPQASDRYARTRPPRGGSRTS